MTTGERFARNRLAGKLMWFLLVVFFVTLLLLITMVSVLQQWYWFIPIAMVSGLFSGYILAVWKYRSALKNLHDGLLTAQDGNLKPVKIPPLHDSKLKILYKDYNQTISTLNAMFALVDECQNRVLDERNRMNVVVQVLPAALLGVDDNLNINIANKQSAILFGMAERYIVGENLFDVLRMTEETHELFRDAFLYKQNIRNQVINLNLNNEERWLSMNLSFVTEDEAEMAAVITLLDITDYRHLQESVYTREKLVAMGQLAGGVAHELNTPLGSILGYSRLLIDACDDPVKARQFATIISDETRRCSRIIQNLLNYARKEQCSGDYCEVNKLVDEVVETLINCRLKRNNITLDRDYFGNPIAQGGCGELDIVITNLLVNAVQALEGRHNPRICVTTREVDGGMVMLTVEDNGSGIPRELRARIFEPFFTTKDVGDGSGLGLSISHAMVTRRGGTLRYDASYDGGTRFTVRLPGISPNKSPTSSNGPISV